MNFDKIVVALDMDENSIETLTQLKQLNFPLTAEIHLVYIFEYVANNFDFTFVIPPSSEDLGKIQMIMLEKMEALKPKLGLDKHTNVITKCFISGNAKQEFLNYADSIDAKLIVAASKERKGFLGLFESSFTNFLTKFSRSNLIILRPQSVYNIG